MQEFAKSCAKRVLTCLHASPINVPMGLHVLPKACQLLIFTCQRANKLTNVSTWCLNVPNDVPIFQLDMPTCQKACQFFDFIIIEKFYIILDIIDMHIICIWCIVHKKCIRLHFYTSCYIKGKCVDFFVIVFFLFFFCFLFLFSRLGEDTLMRGLHCQIYSTFSKIPILLTRKISR